MKWIIAFIAYLFARFTSLSISWVIFDNLFNNTHIITKTRPIEDAALIETGTMVIRNFDNPKQQDKNITDHWNVGVVLATDRAKKGILAIGFPRDSNDFFPARESVYVHNVRTIEQPAFKDIRNFIN